MRLNGPVAPVQQIARNMKCPACRDARRNADRQAILECNARESERTGKQILSTKTHRSLARKRIPAQIAAQFDLHCAVGRLHLATRIAERLPVEPRSA